MYVQNGGKTDIFGGRLSTNVADLGDTQQYDPKDDSWSDLEPKDPVPAPRDGHTMVVGGSSGEVILFGGIGSDDTPLGDTWAYAP